MKKIYLMKNPHLFQGEKYLNKEINYFEGWYFKNTSGKNSIAFIPGINIDEKGKKAFIQVITDSLSSFINYDIVDFKYNSNPFCIQIANNIFSNNRIHIDITDKINNFKINGDLKYSNNINICTNAFAPNIMGPFSYIPYMECNHAILSMRNTINGQIKFKDNVIDFNNGIGYIEKDWGVSFPKSYIWCQGNNFLKSNASFMISVADIPFKILNFRGLICSLIIDNEEYRFTTYNNSKIVKYDIKDNFFEIELHKKSYKLNIKSQYNTSQRLVAPVKGTMNKNIFESISAKVLIELKQNEKIVFSDISTNCGLEIVN